ncbi:MAG: hypothetical protein M3419_06545 [Actinomycetota bacterium]|nr:hypothetical protein [Actinomycetota bacterium]MDQ3628450.1 hypothetical protein [Actinomycetota bacterium]
MSTSTTGRTERIGSPTYRLTTIGGVALVSLFAERRGPRVPRRPLTVTA